MHIDDVYMDVVHTKLVGEVLLYDQNNNNVYRATYLVRKEDVVGDAAGCIEYSQPVFVQQLQ